VFLAAVHLVSVLSRVRWWWWW